VYAVRSKEDNFTSRLQEIYRVENDISTWWQKVPEAFKLDIHTSTIEQRELPKILLVNLVYHQSLCALHSSIIPLFCWSKGNGTYSSARLLSAQVAFGHSCSISNLIKYTLATNCPISAMPLFVAYAAYSGCAVQIPFLWCSEVSVKQRARANVEANISMIQQMSSYWKLASLLVRARVYYVLDVEEAHLILASLCPVPSRYAQTQSTDDLQ
jgi:nitrate reductase NapAB chaperone NapD